MLEQLGIDWKLILVMLTGFLLLVFILSKFAFRPILNLLDKRQSTIQGNIDEAQNRRNEMVNLQRDYESRLAKIEEEARDKIQGAVKEAQAARDEILSKAKSESEAIVARGREEIQVEKQKALIEMRDQVADLAISAATRIVRTNLDGGNHARLVDDVIAGLGSSNGSSTQTSNRSGSLN